MKELTVGIASASTDATPLCSTAIVKGGNKEQNKKEGQLYTAVEGWLEGTCLKDDEKGVFLLTSRAQDHILLTALLLFHNIVGYMNFSEDVSFVQLSVRANWLSSIE